MINNYVFVHVLVQSILFQFICMYMFMGLLARIFNDTVASSSLVGGSGMLQSGIKSIVAALGLRGP